MTSSGRTCRLASGAPQTWDVVALPPDAQPELRRPAVVARPVALAGDVGGGGAHEHATAAAIEEQSAQDPYDILMLLGDNVYPSGDPGQIPATVYEPFGPLLDGGTELFAILGAASRTRRTGVADFTAVAYSTHHYLDLNIYPDHVLLRAIDQDSEQFDEAVIPVSIAPPADTG